MVDKISYSFAARVFLVIPGLLVIFHILNLLGFVPKNIVWTGRISTDRTMLIMGMVSILLNVVFIWFGAVRCNYIESSFSQFFANKLYPFVFWWLAGNTVTNLFSKSSFEVLAFTPILILLTVCCYRIRNRNIDPGD